MIEGIGLQVSGDPAAWLSDYANQSAERLIELLLTEAVAAWASERFFTHSERETAFTIRLYAFCERLIIADGRQALAHQRYPQMQVYYDMPQPSLAMLDGLEDPDMTPRPDMTICIGRTMLRVEAKRLKDDTVLPKAYVVSGMDRYIQGRYGGDGRPGIMLGYVLKGKRDGIIARINNAVSTELGRPRSEHLGQRKRLNDHTVRYTSKHAPDLVLRHYHLRIPAPMTPP